ncbi:MAG: hypothetical protein EAX96_20745, partial [Candidatus Lokiarchaeota archaeon]|nr:hypothetical protein [Candidatus Lokiarchaeota archaeon]
MSKSKIKTLIIIILLFLIPFISLINLEKQLTKNINTFPIKQCAATISINGNAELAANATSGNGTRANPYIIENYMIRAAGLGSHGIYIRNTDAYFILRNCIVNTSDVYFYGIYLLNVSNSNITDCIIEACHRGIQMTSCDNNILDNNSVISINYQGFYINSCDNNTYLNNLAYNCSSSGFSFGQCHNSSFIGNNATGNRYGMAVGTSNNCIVINNVANENTKLAGGYGLSISNCYYATVYNNTANSNTREGIYAVSNLCNITHNNAHDNGEEGIRLDGYANNYSVTYNIVSGNNDGIKIEQSNNSLIAFNTVIKNYEYGVNVYYESYYNNISWNYLIANRLGPIQEDLQTGGNIIENNSVNIEIFDNKDLAGFSSEGDGSISNPYIIEGFTGLYYINAVSYGTHGITIQNTDAHFIIRNSEIKNTNTGYNGINLNNVTNGR